MSEETKSQKSKDGWVRLGLSVREHVHDRLSDVLAMLSSDPKVNEKVGQALFLEAIVSVLSYPEMQEAVQRLQALRKLEAALHRKATRELLGMVRGKNSDHIRQMAVAAERAVEERTN